MVVEIAKQVGRPKLRFPISENACPVIFRSLVHRTTSQGPWTGSLSDSGLGEIWLAMEECREWRWARNGDPGALNGNEDKRD